MKKIYIFGCGGLGREVEWMLRTSERFKQYEEFWGVSFSNVEFVTKDGSEKKVNGRNIISESEFLSRDSDCECYVGIGDPNIRERVVDFIRGYSGNYCFPTLIHKNVEFDEKTVSIGQGTIICDGAKLTVNTEIENFVILNNNCTVGHDTILKSFVTVSPGVNICGNVEVGRRVFFGVNSCTVENVRICDKSIIGASCTVLEDIKEPGTFAGTPARRIK